MSELLPVVISIIALIATIYQLHLQRVHNEKSLKPLPQIDLRDRNGVLYIHLQNNGTGPLIVDKLTYIVSAEHFHRIEDSLTIDPSTYDHLDVNSSNQKIILPGGYIELFAKRFEQENYQEELMSYRTQLSQLTLKAEGKDIYDNKIKVDKNLLWFGRRLKT